MPCASEAGHYVDLTEVFNANNLAEVMAPATVGMSFGAIPK